MGGEIAHRAAVAAASFTFGGGNQLHGANLRRAAESAHVHAGAVSVQHIEILTQFTHHPGDQMHHEGVTVNLG